MMFTDKRWAKNLDWRFILAVFALIAIGIMTIYSASHSNPAVNGGDPFYLVKKQVAGMGIGTIAMLVLTAFDYRQLTKMNRWLYIIGIMLLVAVLFVGKEVNGGKSWIPLGSLSFQPSEVAKILYCITLAKYLSTKEEMNSWESIIGPGIHMGIPLALIMLQPDLGTALVFVAMLISMLFMAGFSTRKLIALLAVGAALSPLAFIYGLKEYQQKRLLIFLDPYSDPMGAGYNVIQSTIAVGSGQLYGKGFMEGSQSQLNFLPEHHTDFIFSVIGEEWGFIGCMVILALFFSVVWSGLRTAAESSDSFGTLMATGLTTMFIFHILINIGMTMSAMPVTGIPLPFLSAGGTSLITNLIAVGLFLSVQARKQRVLF